ncbi:Ger(x)C family spore germination protein [Fontibacillus sp. BL9]|uniref:Ger(x)C family spore germination protein n=1 Tax=Fontibacillus sp. BL9 TaxID=3389971 RepID=UPI00397DA2B4
MMERYIRIMNCLLILPLFAVCLSGCWSRQELNSLAIVLALGIDRAGDEYEVSLQYIDPSAVSRNKISNRSPSAVFSQKANTLFEALRKTTTKASRRMYEAHLRFIVFNEEIAKEGILPCLDFLFRDHEIRPDFYMAIAKNCNAKDIIGFVSATEILPGIDMYRALKTSAKEWSPTSAVNVKDIMAKLSKDGVEPVLTGLTLKGDIERGKTAENVKNPISPAEFEFMGIGVFRHDRLVGWLNEDESKTFSYLTNQIHSSVGKVKCPNGDGWFAVELTDSSFKMIPMLKNDKPHMKLKGKVEGNVGEVQCHVNLLDPREFAALDIAGEEGLKHILNLGVAKVQKYGVDVFGFGEAFHRKYPKHWNQWKTNWNQKFREELTFEFEIEYQLKQHGKINNPFQNKTDRRE